tara:strand:+ start:1175 stop:2110 length:936 start_codon:yes stop_codon:yes gene_type:complete
MELAIKIKDLKKSYKNTLALDGIDLEIKPGQFYGLLGPNGAGKTTTIGIITGLVKLQEGSVSIFGKDIIKDFRFTRSKIGVSPQDFNSDWFFSIEKLLLFQAGYYGIPSSKAKHIVDDIMKKLGIYEKRKNKIRTLSGGMKRRFQIAKALVNDPDILIMDEPTAGVDVELRHMLWDYLKEMHQNGKTILLTTHYIEEAEKLCDYVSIINEGKIVSEGKPEELIQSVGKGSIEVDLNVIDKSKLDYLESFKYTFSSKENINKLIFSVNNPEKSLPKIIDILIKNNCQLNNVKILKPNLEDVFVSLTGRKIND